MGGNGLAIGQGAQLGIFLSAGGRCFLHQASVEVRTPFHHSGILFLAFGEGIENVRLPVVLPVCHPVVIEILDRIQIVISDQQVP